MSQLVDEKQAAQLIAMSPHTLRVWRCMGRGPKFVRVGPRSVRYRLSDLEAFLDESNREPDTAAAATA